MEGNTIPTVALLGLSLCAAGAGVSFVVQQAVNAKLRGEIGSPWWAGFIGYLGGTIAMLAMVFLTQQPWISASAVARSSFMSWTSGVFGAIYIAASILLLPRLGAATLIALIVTGQLVGALVFDHFGLFNLPQHPATPMRLCGAVLLIFGAVLVRL